jgi:hypothetical protein
MELVVRRPQRANSFTCKSITLNFKGPVKERTIIDTILSESQAAYIPIVSTHPAQYETLVKGCRAFSLLRQS